MRLLNRTAPVLAAVLGRAAAVCAAALVLGAVAAAPGLADPGREVHASTVTTTPGQLSFVLTGPGLPDLATLAAGKVTVSAAGTELAVQLGDTRSIPRDKLPTRGVVLAVDAGSAMAGAPLTATKAAIVDYIGTLPADVGIGLVAFADTVRTVLAPTYDRAATLAAVNGLTAASAPVPSAAPSASAAPGASAAPSASAAPGASVAPSASAAPVKVDRVMYDGMSQAVTLLGTEYSERRLVIVTTGADYRSRATATEVASALQANSVALDLVSYGSTPPAAEAVSLATGSGGQAQAVATAPTLTTTVHGLAGRLPAAVAVTATVPPALSGQSTDVAVKIVAGGTTLSTTLQAHFAVVTAVAPTLQTIRLRSMSIMVFVVALGLIGLGLVLVVFVVAYELLGRTAIRRRLRQLDSFSGKSVAETAVEQIQEGSVVMRTALALSERTVKTSGRGDMEAALERAGILLRPAEWMLVCYGVGVGTAFLASLVLPFIVAVILGGLGGRFLPAWYRDSRTSRRARKFGDLLPDALQLVVGALRSGFSLMQAIDAVAREGPEPVAGEFGRAMAEIRLGGEIEEALERTAERNSSRDLAWLVMAIRIQREVGGNLSEVLETAVETMRERGQLGRHVRALSAEGRMSAYVLVGMPIFVSAWLFLDRREYVKPLYTNPIGVMMLFAAVALVAIGGFMVSRIAKVEV